MKKEITIAIWGYGKPIVSILPTILADGIHVAYVRFDKMRDDAAQWIEQIASYGIQVYCDDYPAIDVDLVFVDNYNKIVTNAELSQAIFLNYHVGLLPKWRGNSANGWAIINGEKCVGYTLHRIMPMLDSGDIYYRYEYPYSPDETYYNARVAMDKDLTEHICYEIRKVIDASDSYLLKNKGFFVYCSKFRPIDGDISSWHYTTDEIIRRHYVFAPPLGTGLKFCAKGKIYEIHSLSVIESFAQAKGVAGGVVYVNGNSLWVKTLDTAISLDEIRCGGAIVNCKEEFVIGQRLGFARLTEDCIN